MHDCVYYSQHDRVEIYSIELHHESRCDQPFFVNSNQNLCFRPKACDCLDITLELH